MTPGLKTVIYPVEDLAKAKSLYGALLGVDPVMDEAYYVQFDTMSQEIGLDPNGRDKGMTGPVGYWHVEDIHKTLASLIEGGATEHKAVEDLGGRLIATAADPDGNIIGLLQKS